METEITQNSYISESKFDRGLRITSNVFLILGAIIFIVFSVLVCKNGTPTVHGEFFVSFLNYIALIYLLKFITIKPELCQAIIIPVITFIIIIVYCCFFDKIEEENIENFLTYPVFSFISETIITSVMTVVMCYVIYLYFIKKDQKLIDHSHWFFVIFGIVVAAFSILTIVILWYKDSKQSK